MKVYPPVYFFAAVALMIGLHILVPVRHLIPASGRWLGGVLILAAVLVILWVDQLFKRAGTTIKPFQTSSSLVIQGPYRLSRNPIYASLVLALAGVAILLGSLSPWFVLPLFWLILDRRFVRGEEAMLERAFGDAYAEYRRRVRRWI